MVPTLVKVIEGDVEVADFNQTENTFVLPGQQDHTDYIPTQVSLLVPLVCAMLIGINSDDDDAHRKFFLQSLFRGLATDIST